MDFDQLVTERYSVRQYDSRPVEEEKIQQCLEAVRLAPSSRNSQPWKVIIVDDPAVRHEVARECAGKVIQPNHFVFSAPVLAVLVTLQPDLLTRVGSRFYDRDYALIDNGIAAAHFCLQAADLGLGTCMLGIFNEKALQRILNIPARLRIALVITLGYARDSRPSSAKRKSREEISSRNRY